MTGTILCDLDGTLAVFEKWDGQIGAPVPAMVERVKSWLVMGYRVVVFTPRVAALHLDDAPAIDIAKAEHQLELIAAWCMEHLGTCLGVTAVKTMDVVEVWDDRAVRVEKNTGASELHEAHAVLDRTAIPGWSLPDRLEKLVDRLAEAECSSQRDEVKNYDLLTDTKTTTPVDAQRDYEHIRILVGEHSQYQWLDEHSARTLVARILRAL